MTDLPALDFVWWSKMHAPLRAWTSSGLLCAYARGMSALNGYVAIPKGHPWYGLDYDDVPVDVHGGLTFGPKKMMQMDGDDVVGWVGFDTAHGMDWWSEEELAQAGAPITAAERRVRELIPRRKGDVWTYEDEWTVEKLIQEVNDLARQIAAAA